MPRTFMDSILQRPSQKYAPEPLLSAPPSSSAASSSSKANKWSGPTDLPNRPAAPSSLRTYKAPPASASSTSNHQPSRVYATGNVPSAPASVADSQGTTRSRFGRKKKATVTSHSRNPSSSSYGGVSQMDDGASNAGSNVTYTKKRWWETGSLRGFGKGNKSRAGSIMGDSVAGGESIFSDVDKEGHDGGLSTIPQKHQQQGYSTMPSRRGTRSDYGAPSSRSGVPPLPQHDPAMLKAMSSNTGRLQSGVAPLGQQPPTLRRNPSSSGSIGAARHSTVGLPSATLTPSSAPGAGAARVGRASSVVGSSSASEGGWDEFTKQMAKRDIAKSWTRAPGSDAGSVARRSTVANRVQKELQQDAQFEQIVRDPGVIHGDLLARATSVVGGLAPTTIEDALIPELPVNLRPGSIVGMTSLGITEASRPTSPTPAAFVRAVLPSPHARSLSPPPPSHLGAISPPLPHPRALSPSPQNTVVSPLHSQAQPQQYISEQQQQYQEEATISKDSRSVATQGSTSPTSSNIAPPSAAIHAPAQQRLPPLHLESPKELAHDSDASSEEEENSSSEEDTPLPSLGVLAEEDEDGSSEGGHEMRPGPRSTYLPRSPVRSDEASAPSKYSSFTFPAPRSSLDAGGLSNGPINGFAGVGARPASVAVLQKGREPVPALPPVPSDLRSASSETESALKSQAPQPARSSPEGSRGVVPSQLVPEGGRAATPLQFPTSEAVASAFPSQPTSSAVADRSASQTSTASAESISTPSQLPPSSITGAAPALPFAWQLLGNGITEDAVPSAAPINGRLIIHTTPERASAAATRQSTSVSPPTTPRPPLPIRTSSVVQSFQDPHSPTLASQQDGAFLQPSWTPSKVNSTMPTLGSAMSPSQSLDSTIDYSRTSSSEDADATTRDISDDSGKDGETDSVARVEGVKSSMGDSSKGVTFEGAGIEDSSGESGDEHDSSTTTGEKVANGKGKAVDRHNGDVPSIADIDLSTGISSRPKAQRRISDLSMGNSFAFSHFMGSKITGKSSSRRIKLQEDDSDSDKNASGDDEELKMEALVEQKRLRSMNVGDDFFGSSLGDVLLAIDSIDFTEKTIGQTAALEEEARAQGVSLEETTRAQLQAQQIVSEVRRKRAAGQTDADHKTIQSEAGGLAASFAALWLQSPGSEGVAEEGKIEELTEPELVTAPSTPQRLMPSAISDSPSTWGGRSSSSKSTTPSKDLKRNTSVMDRPRFRPSKFKEVGGMEAPYDKVPGEEGRASVDEQVTLPTLESFYSANTNAPTSPAQPKKSIDLGDQQRSKDKPVPIKSALKPLRPSRSLADTLFSFPTKSPEKKEAKAARKEERERLRKDSLNSKAAKKAAAKEEKEASRSATASSPFAKRKQSSEGGGAVDGETLVASPTPSLIKTSGDPDHEPSDPLQSESANPVPQSHSVDSALSSSDSSRPPTPASKDSIYASEMKVPSSGIPPSPAPWSAASTFETAQTTPARSDFVNGTSAMADSGAVAADKDGQAQVKDSESRAEPAFGMNIIPPTPPVVGGVDGNNYLSSGPNANLSRSVSSASEMSSATAVPSPRKGSMLQAAEAYGFKLPPGLTAVTVATSSDVKPLRSVSPQTGSSPRKTSSSDGGHSPRRGPNSKQRPVPPIPKELAGSSSPIQPAIPPKDDRTRPSFTAGSSNSPRHSSPAGLSNNASMTSLSPPPSTGSWAGSASASSVGADDSPARSGGSGGSSSGKVGRSDAYGVANMAAPEVVESFRQPARVKRQTSGPQLNRRPHLMTAINEWESASPVNGYGGSGYTSPTQTHSPVDGMTPGASPVAPRGQSSFANADAAPGLMRNAPNGVSSESYLQPPVPRSRLSTDERQRLAFEAHVNAIDHAYAASDAGPHVSSEFGDSGYSTANGSQANFAGSVDGHGNQTRELSRPASFMSAYTTASMPMSLTSLPTAPTSRSVYRPQDPVKAASSSVVDDRLYSRTTMATVSVTSGAFAGKRGGNRSRKSSMDVSSGSSGGPAQSSSEIVPEHLQDELGLTVLSLSAHTPPPRKIGSRQILVQVITVSLDEMDRMLLRDKVRTDSAYGFVPGRSFCGRVMEVGWEVKRMRKGDMVFGLQSSRKSGALAEFMIVDQDLVAKAPEDCLTVEQIAALPSTGVLTYQIVQNHCIHLPKGARILILNAHDGIGLLTMQECAALGLIMVAQCPPSISDGLAVCEANGAHEVVVGEPLWAMNSLHESSFDLVIDTIGGRRLYDAARRILASEGQFVTCFGDEHSSANPNFKSHMRSLRRNFFKKDKKNLQYEWIGLENSEDCKEALENVRAVAESGDLCPRLRSILAFEDAPRAFDPVTRGGGDQEPGAVVVRVS